MTMRPRIVRSGALPALFAALALLVPAASAQVVPYWPGTNVATGLNGFNFPVAPWPATDAEWFPYTQAGVPIKDLRSGDMSNGGTSPQSYVNISSGCPDGSLPSIYVSYKVYDGRPYLYFRWRVESAPNNYLNGGSYGSTNPWSSALYTVLVDVNGDGYRDFAFHLDGSSGSPSSPVDQVRGIYSTTLNQSVDYIADPTNIKVTGTNPAAFVDPSAPNAIENFQNSLNPAPTWQNGATVWDYGTSRTVDISTPTCTEYFVDYQIPIGDAGFFDARPLGGPSVVYGSTPIALGFVTSNSLNNSLQKDAALNFPYTACMTCPYPFGDYVQPQALTTRQAPIVNAVAAAGCGPATLTASVTDALKMSGGVAVRTVTAVDFYYYFDTNADGSANDTGSAWTLAASAAAVSGMLDQWTATWNSSALPRGQYLIGVKATDENGNVDWSFYTAADLAARGLPTPPNDVNPLPSPGPRTAVFNNACGSGATITKTGSTATPTSPGTIDFTLTVANPFGTAITLSSLSDVLPTNRFTFDSNVGGTLPAPSTSPAFGAQSLVWTWSSPVTIAATSSATLVFRVNIAALTPTGTYSNAATAATSDGTKTSSPFTFTVGTPSLSIAKSASSYNPNPGDTVTFSLTIADNSQVGVTNLVVTDVLPQGFSSVTPSDGGSYDPGTRTITWNLASLAGLSSRTISYTATVQTPFPNTLSNVLVNTASVTSTETPTPATTSATVVVNVARPSLFIEKKPNTAIAYPGGTIAWTISYQNIGTADAAAVTITDTVPAGFTYGSCSTTAGTCSQAGGVVTFNIGTLTTAAGLRTATVTFTVSNPYTGTDPASNAATINGTYSGSPLPSATSTGQVAIGLPPPACATPSDTRYFKANGPPLSNPFPMTSTAGASEVSFSAASAAGTVEVARFVDSTPEATYVAYSSILISVITDRTGPNLDGQIQLFTINASNVETVFLTSGTLNGLFGSQKTLQTYSVAGSWVVPAGSRFGVRISVVSNKANGNAIVYFDGGTASSRVTHCRRALASAVDKAASALSIEAGQAFSYSIAYANTLSDVSLTLSRVQDTLPPGTTFQSATVAPAGGGSAAANCTQAGQVVTCGVQSAALGVAPPATGGTLGPCGTAAAPTACGGVLTINVLVGAPLDPAITQLDNTAQLLTTEAPASSATAVTRVVGPRLSVLKAVDRTTAFAGDPLTYTMTLLNIGSAAANVVRISDTLAGALTYTSCAFVPPATGTCAAVGQTVTWNLTGSIAPGGSAQVTVTVGTSSVVAPATVSDFATGSAQGSVPAATVSATSNTVSTEFLAIPNLTLAKVGARVPAGTIAPGDVIEYTISLANTGAGEATNVLVSDPIPANTSFQPASITASLGSGSFDAANNRVVFSIPTFAAGASATLTFRVVVGSLPAGDTTITNTATVTAGNALSQTAAATNTATAAPVLTLSKSATAGPVNVGTSFPYTINYENTGNAAAANVVVTDTLQANLVYESASPAICAAAGQVLTCTVGAVAPGVAGTVTVNVHASTSGSYSNTASVTATGLAPVTSNTVRTDVGGLRVAKVVNTAQPVSSGTVVRYAITVTNDLPATTAQTVYVTDPLPTGFTYQAGSTLVNGSAAGDPAAPFTSPKWGPFTIAGSGTLTITFNVAIAAGQDAGTYNNPVVVSSSNVTVAPFDETATTAEDVVVQPPPTDFQITSSVSVPTPCHTPCTATLSFTVSNVGASNGTNVSITIDALDPSITISGLPPGLAGSGNGPFTWTIPSLVAAGSCTGVAPNVCTLTVSFQLSLGTWGSFTQCGSITTNDSNLTNNQACSILAPTRVALASFGVAPGVAGAEVTWETAAQAGTFGFHLYRREGAAWIPVTRSLLPALLASPAGATYRVVDGKASPEKPQEYLLVEQEMSGGRIPYGPFRFGAAPAGASAPPLAPLDFRPGVSTVIPAIPDARGADAPAAVGFRGTARPEDPVFRARVDAAARANAGKGRRPRKDGVPAVKVLVTVDGLAFLDAATFAPLLGVTTEKAQGLITAGRLSLTNRGQQVAWLAAADRSGIFFWGQALRTAFATENVYWLSEGGGTAMTSPKGGAPSGAVSPDQVFTGSVHAEVDTAAGTGKTDQTAIVWCWKYVVGGIPGYDRQSLPVALAEVAPGSEQASATFHVFGQTEWPSSPDHRLSFAVNGTPIGSATWDGQGYHDVTVTFPSTYLLAGDNVFEVAASVGAGIPYTLELLDSVDVSYPRRYRAAGDLLACRGGANATVTAAGFSSASIVVLDVTDPLRPSLRPASVSPAAGGAWQATFAPATPTTPYVVTVLSAARVPKELRPAVSPSPLLATATRGEWVALTVPEMAEAAQRLADRRKAQGLETQVVFLEDVWDAFGDGIPDPRAIRDFVRYAHQSWAAPMRYLLLAGDGSYDFRNIQGAGGNLIPPVMIGTPFGGAAADGTYGDVDGDGIPDVAVGRIPVLSGPELDAVAAKIAAYEDGPRGATDGRLLLVADQPDNAGGHFPDVCDDVAAITSRVPIEKVYRTQVPADTARMRILADLRSGVGFLTFAGHSSYYWLSLDALLRNEDVAALGNGARLPIVTATTCYVASFQVPGVETLGETLLCDPNGGAVAVVGSTLLSMDLQARTLTLELHRAFWDAATPTVGDAMRAGVGAFVRGGGVPWQARSYVLLGDPATRTRVAGR